MDKIIAKLSSGRFLLTITAAGVFVYATVTKLLSDAAVAGILVLVFNSYFLKKEAGNGTDK